MKISAKEASDLLQLFKTTHQQKRTPTMKFRTQRHFLSHISYFVSYLDYLGGHGLGLSRVVHADDEEAAKKIAKRTDAPVFMGEEKKVKLWGFRRAG